MELLEFCVVVAFPLGDADACRANVGVVVLVILMV